MATTTTTIIIIVIVVIAMVIAPSTIIVAIAIIAIAAIVVVVMVVVLIGPMAICGLPIGLGRKCRSGATFLLMLLPLWISIGIVGIGDIGTLLWTPIADWL
jgi:hypothetical protein